MTIDPQWLILLAAVALLAGTIDTLAGGGGLITIPVFLMAGLSPAAALATNKCQAFAGTLTAASRLVYSGHLNLKTLWPYALLAFVSSLLGAWALRESAGAPWLERLVPILLILAALYFGLVRMPESDAQSETRFSRWAVLAVALIGAYDGFFGPGTGSLFALLMVSGLGMALRAATMHAKLFNAMTNLAALALFITSDLVVWSAVAVMIPAQILGALLGTRLILGKGLALVRPLVVLMCLVMAFKLASDAWLP